MEAVVFKNVTKKYKLFSGEKQRLIYLFNKKAKIRKKVAVSDASFVINEGESVAILGKNGAGKTTILKMINGVTYPTSGEIIVNGRVSAILELSAGFDPEFTGRENIRFRCQLYGLSDEEIKKLEPEIEDFAELGIYMDQPVRTYSNGMKSKLGFAINVSIKPQIVIVDEALSVGDGAFKEKCLEKMRSLTQEEKVTFIFTSHATVSALKFCERGIVIKDGKIIFDGPIEDAVAAYKGPQEEGQGE